MRFKPRSWLRPDWLINYFFYKKWAAMLEDGDALVLVPYSDGKLLPKRGYYNKHLVGNIAGYETTDGDLFVMDKTDNAELNLMGVPVVLAVNPSKHAGTVDLMKSLIAHKRKLGEWVRVDRNGDPVERGPAVKQLEPGEAAADGGAVPVAAENPTEINYDVYDGIFDITPPREVKIVDGKPLTDADGELVTRAADGFIVNQSAAADLLPSRTTSSELKLMQQRERNAMADQNSTIWAIIYTAVGVSALWLLFMLILAVATGSLPSVV